MKKKISTTLSVTFIVLNVCLVGIITILFMFYSYNRMYEDGTSNLTQNVDNIMGQIDYRLTNLDQTIVDTLTIPDFVEEWNIYQQEKDIETEKWLKHALIDAYKNKLDIRRVIIYDENGNCISTDTVSVSRAEVKERFALIANKYDLNRANSHVFLEPHIDFWRPELEVEVIAEVKPIKDKDSNVVGYIEVQQNYFYISEICDIDWNKDPVSVFVFMGDYNNCLYEKRTADCKESTEFYANQSNRYMKLRKNGKQTFAIASSNYYDCRTLVILPDRILYKTLYGLLGGILLLDIAVVAVSVIYTILTTKSIMLPLQNLVKHMENINLENLNTEYKSKNTNWETEILESTFDSMTKRLNAALEKQEKMNQVQTKTLFGALQAEIGPHFLYNSLGSIANMCERGENEAAADVCYSLTEILRYASNYAAAEVVLTEEIANIRAYFAIMKGRYRERLKYSIEIEDSGANYVMLPKLTIQPLVENAIKYSLMEKEQVNVEVYIKTSKDRTVLIQVRDNGCGISDDAKKKIQEKIEQYKNNIDEKEIMDNIQFGKMGLTGTLIRQEIFFGECFQYEIQNNENGEGMTISLMFDMKF